MRCIPVYPGEHLLDELESRGMSGADLARRTDLPPELVARILCREYVITGDTARRLVHALGPSARFWLALQEFYERDVRAQTSAEWRSAEDGAARTR